MSLLGSIPQITRTLITPQDLIDPITPIRFADKPIENLGLRPNYGEDGMGLGLLLPTSEEPVDPSKLKPSLQPPLPIIIIGQDEICVGINIGLGYEMQGLVCHRKTPLPPPNPPVPPPPPGLPPISPLPNIPFDTWVVVAIFGKRFESYSWWESLAQFTSTYFSDFKIEKSENLENSNLYYAVNSKQTRVTEQRVSGTPRIPDINFQNQDHVTISKQKTITNSASGEQLFRDAAQQTNSGPIFIGHGHQGGGPIVKQGFWGDIVRQYLDPSNYLTYSSSDSSSNGNGFRIDWTLWNEAEILDTFDNSYKPPPGDPYPPGDICQPPPCPPMNCCCNGQNNDDKELMRAIARAVGATSAQYWMELPKTLKTGKSSLFGAIAENQTVKIQSQSDFNAWLVGQLNELFGQFQVEIEVPVEAQKGSKAEANQLAGKIVISDVSSGLAQIVKLLLNVQDDESENRSFLSRILIEAHLSRLAALDAAARAKILQDWSAAEIEEVEIELPTSFTLPNLAKDLDSIDTKAEITAFLQESKRKVKQPRFKGKATFKQLINPLLQGVAIIRAVFAERINPETAKEDIKKHLKGKDEIASGRLGGGTSSKTGGSESIKAFIKNIEKQFPGAKIEIVKKDK